MTFLAVDTNTLAATSQTLRAAADQAERVARPHDLDARTHELRSPVLTAAVDVFVDRWRYALRSLVDDTRRLADALDLVCTAYTDLESAVTPAWASHSRGNP